MAHEEFEQHVALYAVGALEQPDIQALEAHLAEGCQICTATLREYRETAGLLPHGLPITAPPQELKGRIETAVLAQVLAQPEGANADATIRTPDSDVTIRTPDQPVVAPAGDVTVRLPNQPEVVPAGDVTVRLPNQPAAAQEFEATVRMSSAEARAMKAAPAHSAWWAKFARPALAAASIALVVGISIYTFSLKSKVAMEVAQRQEVEAAFQQQTMQAGALRQELTKAQQELAESRQRLSTTVAQREIDIEQMHIQLVQKEQELVALYKKASPKDEMLVMLQSANVRVLSLAGTDAAKSAGGLVLYDAERGKVFLYAFNMPALPRGKVYQLWTITTKPVSAGTFSADTGRKCRHLARSLQAKSGITKFAVSVEPEGGKPQPTGAIYLHGSL
jgi:anti-sigma-K factor RskA